MPPKAARSPDAVYQLKITLKDSEPPIWRRVLAPGRLSLFMLHQALQAAMGWTDSHLHQFSIHGGNYSIPGENDIEPVIDERRHRLWKTVPMEGMRFSYEYDFGDRWDHLIEVEEIKPPDAGFQKASCIGGARACPPEDIGGVWGYALLLQAMADPSHEELKPYEGWIDERFDPEAFDIHSVNRELSKLNFHLIAATLQ